MEDLYPGWDGLEAATERLATEVLPPLLRGEPAEFARWDWTRDRYGPDRDVVPSKLVTIVEGVGSGTRAASSSISALVFVDALSRCAMAGRWPGTGRAIGPTGNAGRHRNGPISPVNDPGTGQLSRSFQGASRVRVYADRVSRWGTNFTTAARSRWVGPVLRVLVAGVFLYTGWAKIQDIDDTIRSVRNYQLLPEAVVPTVGSALPVVELILGACCSPVCSPGSPRC